MSDIELSSSNAEGFSASSDIDGFELTTHAQGKGAPSPNEILVADYAQCFSYAFRATAMRGDYADIGAIEAEASADINDEDDLTSISLTLHVEQEYSDAEVEELIAGAEDLCHVHAALKESLHADVSVHTGA